MQRTITIDAKSNLSVKPDKTCVILTLNDKSKSYQEILKKSAEDLNIVVNSLKEVGFLREELRTSYFTINQKKDGHYEQNKYVIDFDGFEYIENIKIEFNNNNELINKILVTLANISLKVEVAINYFIGDVTSKNRELEALAIKEATEKALSLTKVAGVKLGKILSIECLDDSNVFSTNDVMIMNNLRSAKGVTQSFNVDMEPENIKLTKLVKLVYEIE